MIFVVVSTLCGNTLCAQSQLWDCAKSDEKTTLRGEVGLNLSSFTHVERWDKTRVGVNVGVMAEKPVFNSLSAKVGVFYTIKGSMGNNDGGFGGSLKTTFSPAYLEIPVLASYRYQLNDNMRIQFDFGPYFAFGLHGKDKKHYSGNGSFTSPSDTEINLFTEQLKRFDLGLRFGPEIVFGGRLAVSLQYETSIIDISNMGGKIGNSNFMINLSFPILAF